MLSPTGVIDEVLAALYPAIRVTCWRVLGAASVSVEDADDAAQNAALAVWLHWSDFSPAGGTRQAWAATIAQHAAIDVIRRQQRRAHLVPLSEADGTAATDPMPAALDRALLADVRRYLTDREWTILVLLTRGYTYVETAAAMGLGTGNIKGTVARVPASVRHRSSGRSHRHQWRVAA